MDPQKYAVDDERLQLSVLDLQYEDAGQYWCRFSSGNSSAGSIEIRGIHLSLFINITKVILYLLP